ncbi:MAG: imidazole glycerol phosphate synthase subunit HisH [Candidatus Omnitrophota bacterium]|nr:imidazole glycerol phosphate synthase subunit HisH [Candidatus Omnitrophota bacterium]
MITIIDYGMGNLRSVQKAFERFTPEVRISASSKDIRSSEKIVLPGVGAFKKAMEELKKRGLVDAIIKSIESDKPFLGICLGLQLLFSESEEGKGVRGLDVFKGKVKRFEPAKGLKIPHMGWNAIKSKNKDVDCNIFNGVPDPTYMYFVHSYYVEPEDKNIILCETDYGRTFTSGICKGNLCAFQFHPEKSQSTGLKIIKNFAAN